MQQKMEGIVVEIMAPVVSATIGRTLAVAQHNIFIF